MKADAVKDFGWKEPKTSAHGYLLKTIEKILSGIKVPGDALVLDAGCGGGNIMHHLYKNGFENIWGFDISESGIKIAKQEFVSIQNRFTIHNGYERELNSSFPQRGYNLVLSVEVIEHLISPKKYLLNVHDWLQSGGYLILSTPYHGYLKNLLIALFDKFDAHTDSLHEGGHIKFFSKETIFNILNECGFKPLGFYGSGRLPYLWKSMIIVAKKA